MTQEQGLCPHCDEEATFTPETLQGRPLYKCGACGHLTDLKSISGWFRARPAQAKTEYHPY